MNITNPIMIMITRSKNVIQIGERTHHQDQSIFPSNFSAINRTVKAPVKPNPALELELDVF